MRIEAEEVRVLNSLILLCLLSASFVLFVNFLLDHDSNPNGSTCHCFTSKRLTADQLPGVPEAELARTLNHILIVGSVLVVNCETVVF